ncbi:oxidoreductase [Aliamphritea spongicola]|uniref:oxidoreductase n=1 Tax=Aliamphritea spongicola TaxID=707589 RepID=UPI00196B64D1|nr:FAD-dependent oxidoreductase [Aliamphritea spongicola]MBN3561919.1 FAD-dependent oxidoreductase [Aliamphritea spongicola]
MANTKRTDPLLEPFQLRHLTLRNRIFSSAHAPSYVEDGHPRDRYRLYHEEKAKGGVALTMIGGSTNIAPDSPSVFGQLYAGDDSIIPWFQQLTAGVQQHGAAIMCQITHMGRRTVTDAGHWLPAIGPSVLRERAHRGYPKAMEQEDIDRVIAQFCDTAVRCQQGGFDGIELLSHSHLLGQFLSPLINTRDDGYGGNTHNRLRFVMEVLDAVRAAVGPDFVVGMRLTADELLKGGMDAAECIQIARAIAETGQLDFFNLLAGAPYDDLGLAGWIPPMGMPSAAHLSIVGGLKEAVDLPVLHAGGIADIATARHAVSSGLLDMVGMTRAQIADPYLVQKLAAGNEDSVRPCVGMGYCVDRVNQGKDALCGHNPATGREQQMSHVIARDTELQPQKVVIVGGGPAGLEAARVWGLRGHQVVLLEAGDRLGGQLNLAAKGETRAQMASVTEWLISQVEALGVTVHYHTYADAERVLAEQPDWVIVATGGLPMELGFSGEQHCHTGWDVLGGDRFSGEVLLFDEQGGQAAASSAEVLALAGCEVRFVTPDHSPLRELGPTTHSVAMRSLYAKGVQFMADREPVNVVPEAGRKRVTLRNLLTGAEQDLLVDAVVTENATQPLDEVYFELKAASVNHGQYDQQALVDGRLVLPELNPEGQFKLLRIGDAVAHRGLHAALYDALRFSLPA